MGRNFAYFITLFNLFLETVVDKYNRTWNSSINTFPFQSFKGREHERVIVTQEFSEKFEDIEFPKLIFVEEKFVEPNGNEISNNDGAPVLPDYEEQRNAQIQHNKKYLAQKNKYLQMHLRKNELLVGDKVFLKKDFDNNKKKRKMKFDQMYFEEPYEVIEKLQDSFYKIKEFGSQKILTVTRSRLNKITIT